MMLFKRKRWRGSGILDGVIGIVNRGERERYRKGDVEVGNLRRSRRGYGVVGGKKDVFRRRERFIGLKVVVRCS